MALKLMYITNDPNVALLAEKSGVDKIFIDLELLGKEKRQGHLNTVISRHKITDIQQIKHALTSAELLVRVNPIYEKSIDEINTVIKSGSDVIMLPMFKTKAEVTQFINNVDGRCKTCLLLETPQALARINDILEVDGIDEVHIGLNDLHIGMGLDFMFELLGGGLVEYMCNVLKSKNITYGFGGIARIGYGLLPAEYIIAEHYRLGSSMAILSRSFCDANIKQIYKVEAIFEQGVKKIREYEKTLFSWTEKDFINNKDIVRNIINTSLCNACKNK